MESEISQKSFHKTYNPMIYYPGSVPDFKSHYNIRDIIFNSMCAWHSMKHIAPRTTWIRPCFGVLSSGVRCAFDDNGGKSVDFGVNCPKSLVKKYFLNG